MSSKSDIARALAGRQLPGMILFSMGLYAMVLGWTVPPALLSWPGATGNDSSWGPYILSLFLQFSGGLLMLGSLLYLKVHWQLVIGVFLVALIALYLEGRLFPTDPYSLWIPSGFLTAVLVLVLSVILLVRVHGLWPDLWRTLLVTGVSAAIVYVAAYVSSQIAASGPGSTLGNPPPGSPIYPLSSLLVGGIDILVIVYWLRRRGREFIRSGRQQETPLE
jgi:hypothetical protein